MHTATAKYFTVLALFFGLAFAVFTPPFQSPDEYNHFFRAWQVSEGRFMAEARNGNRLGGVLPASLDTLKRLFLPLKGDYKARVGPGDFTRAQHIRLRPDQRIFTDFPNTAIYAPAAYLPQAAGIATARLFTDRPLYMLYAARCANLLIWVALLALAIRAIPFYQVVLAVISLLPASLVIAASCNADVLVNGLSCWLIAAFCRATQRQGSIAILTALVVLAVQKLVLFPLALLAGLPAFHNWVLWKTALRRAGLPVLLTLFMALGWGWFSARQFIPYDRYDPVLRDQQTLNPGVEPAAQLHYVWHHPLGFLKTIGVSAARSVPSLGAHLVGKFGWEKNYLPGWIILALWLAVAGAVLGAPNPLNRAQRTLVAAIVLGCVSLWALTMYALWCPVGAPVLDNWQGRYFVPVFPLLLMAVGKACCPERAQTLQTITLSLLVLGNSWMLYSIWTRYYGF